MTGKKVFTGAGEYLASFLLNLKQEETQTKNINDTLSEITGSSSTNMSQGVSLYQNSKTFTKEELLTYTKEQFRKEMSYYMVSTSGMEITPLEMSQILYNTIKWVETETEARFETLAELVTDNFAQIFKTIGSNNRNILRNLKVIKQNIADFNQFALDKFVGSATDKSRLYFRMDGAVLKICDGAGTGASFKEIFRIKAKEFQPNQAWVGDEIVIGGTEENSPFKTIRFVKDIFSEGNISLAEGKELLGTAMKARYADLAEYYTANMAYRPGTLLQIDIRNQNEATQYDPTDRELCEASGGCMGVVSDLPGFILNENLKSQSDFPVVPIVLTGKSPVRIIGPVSKGDYIYPSKSIPGVAIAIKPTDALTYEMGNSIFHKRIGIALESSQPIDFGPLGIGGINGTDQINQLDQTESLISVKIN